MIYILDGKLEAGSHSQYILEILRQHTAAVIDLIELPSNPTYGQLYKIVGDLFSMVKPNDILLCPWAVDADRQLDDMFTDLADVCYVVAAAGNFDKDIKHYSPARAEKVIAVACLNKSGLKAALSNWSQDKKLVWIPGTNYNVGWKNSSGTSVSAAVYTAFLAESIKLNDPDHLTKLMQDYQSRVFLELGN